MIFKIPGNDLLQKITLRKLYFPFKVSQKKKDKCQKSSNFGKIWPPHQSRAAAIKGEGELVRQAFSL